MSCLRFGAVLTAFFASLGASFRSWAALQLAILELSKNSRTNWSQRQDPAGEGVC
jgi:hypothetical protein